MLIEEYFQDIEKCVADCPYITESQILKDKRSLYIGIIEGKIYFTDESILHFIEFVNVKEQTEKYKYSYHYQSKDGKLIFRYDIAPHHKEIKTYPHHKHLGIAKVIKASEPCLAGVLGEIEEQIKLAIRGDLISRQIFDILITF